MQRRGVSSISRASVDVHNPGYTYIHTVVPCRESCRACFVVAVGRRGDRRHRPSAFHQTSAAAESYARSLTSPGSRTTYIVVRKRGSCPKLPSRPEAVSADLHVGREGGCQRKAPPCLLWRPRELQPRGVGEGKPTHWSLPLGCPKSQTDSSLGGCFSPT